jgi:hypothetical protein
VDHHSSDNLRNSKSHDGVYSRLRWRIIHKVVIAMAG